jgi:hypothetical protein
MAERDGAAMGVHVLGVVRQAKLAQASERFLIIGCPIRTVAW